VDSFYPVKPFYAEEMDTFNPPTVQFIVLLGDLLILIAMEIKVFIQDVIKKEILILKGWHVNCYTIKRTMKI